MAAHVVVSRGMKASADTHSATGVAVMRAPGIMIAMNSIVWTPAARARLVFRR